MASGAWPLCVGFTAVQGWYQSMYGVRYQSMYGVRYQSMYGVRYLYVWGQVPVCMGSGTKVGLPAVQLGLGAGPPFAVYYLKLVCHCCMCPRSLTLLHMKP
jgi:hypothetical protein